MPEEHGQTEEGQQLKDAFLRAERARMFIALPVPRAIVPAVEAAWQQYPQYIEQIIPPEKWHLTLAWLGEVENPRQYFSRLSKDMLQEFLPTVRINHVGRGRQRPQLWAYIDPAVALLTLREQLLRRLVKMRFPVPKETVREKLVPHIHIADLYGVAGGVGLADYPVAQSFAAREAHIILSELKPRGSVFHRAGVIRLSD